MGRAASRRAPPSPQPAVDLMVAEYLRCEADAAYFLRTYVQIEIKEDDGDGGTWGPFELWPAQEEVLRQLQGGDKLLLILKARQLGMTWLALAFYLWKVLFRPGSAIGLWSKRLEEAIELLDRRVKGMHKRLPTWLQARDSEPDNKTAWELSNGSRFLAFTTSSGDSYTFTDALVDEADLCPDLGRMLNSVKPTIDGGGRMVLLSKVDKSSPQSIFKRLFREAEKGRGPWRHVFLPWTARPGRDAAWYEAQREHSLAQDETLDFLHENYPATPAEALSPTSQGKRLPGSGLLGVYEESDPLPSGKLPAALAAIDGLRVYRLPAPGRRYRIGADPAEGLPGAGSDDSGVTVVEELTGEQVASGLGRWEPEVVFPGVITALSTVYTAAPALIERNNHGHAVIGALKAAGVVRLLCGPDERPGLTKSAASKALLWSSCWAEIQERRQARQAAAAEGASTRPPPLIRDAVVYSQLASLEAATCKAPKGEHDDGADAWGLAQYSRLLPDPQGRAREARTPEAMRRALSSFSR